MRLKFGAFLAAILLLCVGGNVSAQGVEDNILYVNYFINAVSDSLTPNALSFMGEIADRLLDLDINVVFAGNFSENMTPAENPAANMYFESEFDGERIIIGDRVTISSTSSQLSAISPILENQVSVSFLLSTENAEYIALAMMLYSANRCELALPLAEDWSETSNNTPQMANRLRGNCAVIEGDLEQAAELYEGYIYSEMGDFYGTNLAWVYFQLGREDEAFSLLTEAVEESEGFADLTLQALIPRAQLYALAFRYDEAIADMDAAIELEPDNPELYVLRGNITLLIYEWDRVLADYNTAIDLDPNYADAYFYRGVFYYTRTEYDLALDDLNHYLELAPDGIHTADATTYIEEIERTQEALDG